MIILGWTRENIHKPKKVLVEKGLGMVSISPYYDMYQLPCVDNFFRVVSCQNNSFFCYLYVNGLNCNGSTFSRILGLMS